MLVRCVGVVMIVLEGNMCLGVVVGFIGVLVLVSVGLLLVRMLLMLSLNVVVWLVRLIGLLGDLGIMMCWFVCSI